MDIFRSAILMKILQTLLYSLSPIIIAELGSMVEKLRLAAAESANPWDDVLVEILDNILRQIAPPRG